MKRSLSTLVYAITQGTISLEALKAELQQSQDVEAKALLSVLCDGSLQQNCQPQTLMQIVFTAMEEGLSDWA